MLCEVCQQNLSKYKCSTCHCPYCSLNCWKKHKSEDDCKIKKIVDDSIENSVNEIEKSKYFTDDTVREDQLRLLGESTKLKTILKNRNLQFLLKAVNNSSNPEEAVKKAMKDPEFVELVDECLKIVEDPNE